VLGDVPVLGSLFRSKSFQKNETELIFIVTAQLVKPVNRDDLPQMRGVDGLKSGSPLGLEPKSEEIQGRTGFSVTGQNGVETPAAAKPAEPAKTAEPVVDPKAKSGAESSGGSSTSTSGNTSRNINPPLPVALTMPMAFGPQPLKP
jgi:pilus assembly protein CpaC